MAVDLILTLRFGVSFMDLDFVVMRFRGDKNYIGLVELCSYVWISSG
jgi:hypothetical protein